MTAPAERMHVRATLPSGRTIRLRELSGQDELHAFQEAGDPESSGFRVVSNWSMIHRSIVELDDKPFDPAATLAEGVRDLFSRKDWVCVQRLFDELHLPTEGEAESFRGSIRYGD
jgi:hypothetical protein